MIIYGILWWSVCVCGMPVGLHKILFHFEAVLHNNILRKHPLFIVQYIVQYYRLLLIAPPRPELRYF